MPRDKVYMIVEGHGEADPPSPGEAPAAKALTLRMLQYVECWQWHPAPRRPWRLRSCGDFYPRTERLLKAIEAHRQFQDCAAILVLFDLEDDCPREVAPQVTEQIRTRGPWPFSIVVVCAYREYESWFLASLETIHDEERYHGDPEAPRDAKGWLEREFGYKETRDQAAYTWNLDIERAAERSRSFQRLRHAFEQLATACKTRNSIVTP
jgi:hypothetical protein